MNVMEGTYWKVNQFQTTLKKSKNIMYNNFVPNLIITQMNRIDGFGSLPYMGITGIHTIMNRVSYFKTYSAKT